MIRLLLPLFIVILGHVHGNDYCQVKCSSGGRHVLCKTAPIEGLPEGLSCKGYNPGLSDAEKTMILDTLNSMRSRVATGQETINKQPTASNMVELRWDKELEATAQGWANECMMGMKDDCRVLADDTPFGQLMDDSHTPMPEGDARGQTINRVMHKWYEGVLTFHAEEIAATPDRVDIDVKDKYAQIVNADTTHVGCGMIDAKAEEAKYYVYRMVCNFKPPGNRMNEPIYLVGQPKSACPAGYRGKCKYEGLCGDGF